MIDFKLEIVTRIGEMGGEVLLENTGDTSQYLISL
jgi:hypothetical protein